MSIHLMLCAAKTTVKPSAKLVLLCLCEAARDGERRAWPGPEAMGQWASVSRARVFECLSDLAELRLIEQTRRGQKHQRAEYVVFPDGCCEVHGPVSLSSGGRDAETPVDSPTGRTLSESQGPVFASQRPPFALSASGTPDASLNQEPSLTTTGFFRSSDVTPPKAIRTVRLPVDEDCEHGVDRYNCPTCAREKTA